MLRLSRHALLVRAATRVLFLLLFAALTAEATAQERQDRVGQPSRETLDRSAADSSSIENARAEPNFLSRTIGVRRTSFRRDTIRTHTARLKIGREILAAGDHAQATQLFQSGLDSAVADGDTTLQVTYLFNLALTLQAQSLAEPDSSTLSGAATRYLELIELESTSGAARNNLAKIYAQSGQIKEAADQYERAIALGDDRQAFYALNYAGFLEQSGDGAAAIRYYELARAQEPHHPAAHEGLIRLYSSHDVSALAAYLWDLVGGGQEIIGTETALELLLRADPLQSRDTEQLRQELLTVVAVGLSKQYYEPSSFAGTPEGRSLRRLVADDAVGAQAAALLHLHLLDPRDVGLRQGADVDLPFESWDIGRELDDPPRGVWPREGFRALARSLGDWHLQHQDTTSAEGYYLIALNMSEAELDLQAILRLANLYLAAGNSARVEDLITQYSSRLYGGKGAAYRHGLWKNIFEYHRVLGTIYAILERWGSSNEVTSAIFQLERARQAVREFNSELDESGEPLRFDPMQVNLLARAYTATGQEPLAVRLRLDMAENYLDERADLDAHRVLQPLEDSGLPPDISDRDRARYEALRAASDNR